ncbi:hypothetical protein [Anaeromyxobacter sp. Fw109-5]|uniref:hypothetical protein n=1 Tax=Anaeromyxobacter sp. (strain Fw109-5) TaxID=404589 RepID=UPI0000ED8B8F|nr:hypothetical protein [Anaeromyxobacter sp. Fw109-5]ABS27298.1 hypothetical protein Anae109_3102 [Anaeromyxobacter sp. Fw109-5]
MRAANHPIRLVDPAPGETKGAPAPAAGDVALVAALLGVNLVPIVGELAHEGWFGPGTVGLATAFALLTGRELCREVRSLVQAWAGRA